MIKPLATGVIAVAFVASTAFAFQLEPADQLPAPAGFVQVSPCVAHMGAHYARTAELPLGPILGYDEKGNLIFFEYMVSQKDFENGMSWENLPGLAGRSVDHIDINFNPHGHDGYEVPHYDIHFYLICAVAQHAVCPDGIKVEQASKVVRYARP